MLFYALVVGRGVALRKESVDRNSFSASWFISVHASLSARRAWIEITSTSTTTRATPGSLSARRAWIEIARIVFALLANGGRSPQGERG